MNQKDHRQQPWNATQQTNFDFNKIPVIRWKFYNVSSLLYSVKINIMSQKLRKCSSWQSLSQSSNLADNYVRRVDLPNKWSVVQNSPKVPKIEILNKISPRKMPNLAKKNVKSRRSLTCALLSSSPVIALSGIYRRARLSSNTKI